MENLYETKVFGQSIDKQFYVSISIFALSVHSIFCHHDFRLQCFKEQSQECEENKEKKSKKEKCKYIIFCQNYQMSICEICLINDKLNICPKCSRNVCQLCIQLSDCDLCILIEMKFALLFQQHKSQTEEQEYQLKLINEKINTLNEEIFLIQKANSLLNKKENKKSESLEFQMSETIIDKQHELEDIEGEIENQKVKQIDFSMILVDNANEELNELKSQQLKLTTLNKQLDLKITESEKEYEMIQETLNLKKQQIYQILQTLKNKTSLIRGSQEENHYSQSNIGRTQDAKQPKAISVEEKSQNQGLCTGQCIIQ